MSEYKQIKTRMWQDNWFLSLTPEEKLLWLFLLTNEYSHISGLYELPTTTIEPLSGIKNWDFILAKFVKDKKIRYQDGWIYILNKKKHQPISDKIKDNVNISIKKYLQENKEILDKFESFNEAPCKGVEAPCQTLRQRELEVEQQIELEVELEDEWEATPSKINKVIDIIYKAYGDHKVFGNPFTRADTKKLIESFSYPVVVEMAEFAVKPHETNEFIPVVSTPQMLLSKWPALVQAREKKANKKIKDDEEDVNMTRFLEAHPHMREKYEQSKLT